MAIANSDGSIILSTKVDTSGVNKGFTEIGNKAKQSAQTQKNVIKPLLALIEQQQQRLQALNAEYAEFTINGQKNTKQAKKLKAEINKLSAEMKENQATVNALGVTSTTTFSKMKSGLMALASYFIGIQTIFAAFRFSGESAEFATQTEASVQRLVDIYGSASDSVGDFIDANARALGMSKAAAASFSSVYGNLFSVWADQATNAELTNRYLNMTAVVASKTGRTVEDVQERVRSGLLGNTEAIEDLGIFVNVKTIEMTDAFQRMADGKSWDQLDAYTQQQIRSMAILEQSTAKYGDEVADTSATMRNRYKAAYEDFQNSWGNIVNTVLLPVLETLTQIFDIVTKGLNILSGKSGEILENVKLQEENTDKTAENIKKQADNQKNLNKEMKKTLAGFDDIQILSANTAGNTSGGLDSGLDSGLQGIGGDLGGNAPNGSAYVEEINGTLAAIMLVVAEAMIAVGLILLFTGNIGWGVGAIVFGLVLEGIAVGALTNADPTSAIITSLLFLQGIAIGASVALGIMMIYMGSKGLGIGLIAYGALQLGVTIYEITQFSTKPVETIINTIQGIAAGAMLAIGFFLLYFKVNMKLAVSLIAGGALLIVDKIFDIVAGGVSPEISAWINRIMLILEGAALVIGVILLMSKVNIPLGISLVATGAFALGKEVAVNWDHIVNALRGPIGKITALVSASLLVIGILVCFVNLPLGIALIAAGAVGLVTVTALNWNSIVDWVKGAWNAVKEFWNKSIAPVFTAKWWKDLAIKCGNGLIAGFEGAINGIIWAFESMINWVVDGLNQISINIPDWVPGIGGQKWGVNIPRATLDRVSIPRLAQGAVIPPNREFLAVLGDQKQGTNIETPLATMVEAFQMALDSRVGYSGGNTEVVLEIDGREFGRAVVEQGDRENRRIGTRLVVV